MVSSFLKNLFRRTKDKKAKSPLPRRQRRLGLEYLEARVVPSFTTTTVLTSSASPVDAGTAVLFTATVTDTGGGPSPTAGTVSFFDGKAALSGTVNYSTNGSGQLVATLSETLAVDSHNISADYSGDGTSAASASNVLVETVNEPLLLSQVGGETGTNVSAPVTLLGLSTTSNALNGSSTAINSNTGNGNALTTDCRQHL